MLDEKMGQCIQHFGGIELSINADHQHLPGVFVDNVQCSTDPPVSSPIWDEVIGPERVGALGPQTNTGPVIQPEPTLFLLLLRDFQPFTAPDALNSLVVHMPARVVQQAGDHAIAMALVLAGQLDDVVCQTVFICTALGRFALRRSVLAECATGAALRHAQLLLHMVGALAMTPKAQKFPFAASLKMTLPNVRSDTARRSRWFSFCNSFKRIGFGRCIPPYSFRHR